MKNRFKGPFVAACALAAAGSLSSCEMLGITDNTYTLDVRQVSGAAGSVQTLYVIVARHDQVAELVGDESRFHEILDEKRVNGYTSFRQYQPVEPDTWQETETHGSNKKVTIALKDKGRSIRLAMPKSFVASVEHDVIVLGYFGADGYRAVYSKSFAIAGAEDHLVEVGPAVLELQAKE
jgi:hypothetical protein